MKRLVFSLMMLVATCSAYAQQYYGKVVDPDGYTNIRRAASTSSPIVGRYNAGDYLYYTPQKNGWSKVYSGARSNTYMGYMHTSRIKRVNPNSTYDNAPTVNYHYGYIVDPVDNYVNIRKGPGTNYAIVGRLNVGDVVYYTKTKSNWYKIYNFDNKKYLGYMYHDRINEYEDCTCP